MTDDPAGTVAVNATLTALDRAGVAAQAATAASQGFGCVKVKVGVGDDAGRVAAVRAALGSEVALRLDANGAWDAEEAVRAIDARTGRPSAGRGANARPGGGTGGARARQYPRGDRRDGGRARRAWRGSGRRGVLEDLSLRRDLRRDRSRGARARLRRGGLSRLHARWAFERGGRSARRRGARLARPRAPLRPGDAQPVRGPG